MNIIDSISRHRIVIWAPVVLGAFVCFMMIFGSTTLLAPQSDDRISVLDRIVGRNWPLAFVDGSPWVNSKASFIIGISKEVTGDGLCIGSACQVEHRVLGSDSCGSFEGTFRAIYNLEDSDKVEGKVSALKRTFLDLDCSEVDHGLFEKLQKSAALKISEEHADGDLVRRLTLTYDSEKSLEFVERQNLRAGGLSD